MLKCGDPKNFSPAPIRPVCWCMAELIAPTQPGAAGRGVGAECEEIETKWRLRGGGPAHMFGSV